MQTFYRLSLTSLLVWSISCGSDESATTAPATQENPSSTSAAGPNPNPSAPMGTDKPADPESTTNNPESSEPGSDDTKPEDNAQLADIKAQMDDPNRPDALKPLALPDAEEVTMADAEEDPASEVGTDTHPQSECEVHLKEIQEAQNNSGYEPAPIDNWTPDDNPTATARPWSPPMEFEDTWSTAEPLFGSYKVTVNGNQFTAYCKEDLDGDGTLATWEIAQSGLPKKTSAEGTH